MSGISAIATNIPRYRLRREVIARAWGGASMGGERAVANHDEDSLTLAVGAALELGPSAAGAGVYFATTSASYAERQGAATVLTAVRLAHRGTLFTFTVDHVHESLDPPVAHGVIDLDDGGRIYLQLTDCDAEALAIDMPLELTFRRLHDAGGFHNYFWKARPA